MFNPYEPDDEGDWKSALRRFFSLFTQPTSSHPDHHTLRPLLPRHCYLDADKPAKKKKGFWADLLSRDLVTGLTVDQLAAERLEREERLATQRANERKALSERPAIVPCKTCVSRYRGRL